MLASSRCCSWEPRGKKRIGPVLPAYRFPSSSSFLFCFVFKWNYGDILLYCVAFCRYTVNSGLILKTGQWRHPPLLTFGSWPRAKSPGNVYEPQHHSVLFLRGPVYRASCLFPKAVTGIGRFCLAERCLPNEQYFAGGAAVYHRPNVREVQQSLEA